MGKRLSATAEQDESASLFTVALVFILFGVLSGIEAAGWAMTSTFFFLAAAAAGGGLVRRNAKNN